MNLLIWGLGEVGYSFACKLKENNYLDSSSFYCVDSSIEAKNKFLKLGGKIENFTQSLINQDNYQDFLKVLNEGDFLLDFSTDVKNLEILEYCLNKNIHYLSTADSSWPNDKCFFSCHQHYLEYLKLKEKYKNQKHKTCMIEFGMNPGLVSSFAKKCIKEIVKNDKSLYVRLNRKNY